MSHEREIVIDEETYELTQKCECSIKKVLRFALDTLKVHYGTQDTP